MIFSFFETVFFCVLSLFFYSSPIMAEILFFICGFAERNKRFPSLKEFRVKNMSRDEYLLIWVVLCLTMLINLIPIRELDEINLAKFLIFCPYIFWHEVLLSRASIFYASGLRLEQKPYAHVNLRKDMYRMAFSPELNRREYRKMFAFSDFLIFLCGLCVLVSLILFIHLLFF